MIKRVNFTGRRRIPRDRIDIEVHDGQPRTFDAKIDLEELYHDRFTFQLAKVHFSPKNGSLFNFKSQVT